MATPDKENQEDTSFLDMSDEDLANFDTSNLVVDSNTTDAVNTDDVEDEADETDDEASDKDDKDEDDTQDDVDDGATDEADTADEDTDAEEVTEPTTKTKPVVKEKVVGDTEAKAGDEGAKAESDGIDYKAEYEKLTGTFKANGRDITVKSTEDAIALMQMGANYNKKMSALKPNLKLMKMLEQNGLLDEAKLSYLIDLDKKDPAAINKLVMDSKMDPLDLSTDKANEYKPGNHSVDERALELDAVISELEGTQHYDRTLQVVSTKWDQVSKSEVAKHPQILKVINDHMESGVYDRITAEVENQRTFGRLTGMSELEAYKQVGDALHAQGKFNDLFTQTETKPAVKVIAQPKLDPAKEDKLRDKKRAAGFTKTAPAKAVASDFNPLSMSDADFAKFNPI